MLAPPKTDVFESWQWVQYSCKDLKGLQTCIIPNHKISKRQVKNGRSLGGGTIQLPPAQRSTMFSFLLMSKRQYLLGTCSKNKVGTLLLSKKMSTYSGQKAQHFLKEANGFKLQRSFPCLKKGNFIHKLQFSFQTKYDFVQETVPYTVQSIPLNMQCFFSEEVQSSFQTNIKPSFNHTVFLLKHQILTFLFLMQQSKNNILISNC